jgi:Abnormal spindle-like microcephaly-assoc'd, ASPM-SPD-2-Hydin/Bacterial pre-peptidase C-terminal domain
VPAAQTGAPNFNVSSAVTAAGTYYLAVKGAAASTIGAYGATITFTAAPVTGAPEIDLLGKDSSVIADGSTATAAVNGTAFGSLSVGASAANVFTVRNSGTAALSVGSVQISGAGAAMFRVSVAPPASVSAGRTATFTITYAPTAAGTHTADVSIANNDANENPYNFRLTGTATAVSGDDHGNTLATATSAVIPLNRACRLEKSGDIDVFKFTVAASTTLTLRTTGGIDTYGTLYNAGGTVLAEADDSTDLNFRIRRTFSPGTYYLAVDGYDSSVTGSYSVVISQ